MENQEEVNKLQALAAKQERRLSIGPQWRCVSQGYKIKAIIGSGAFGQVVRAKHRASGSVVAIKSIPLNSQSPEHYLKVIREVVILRELTKQWPGEDAPFPRLLDARMSEDGENVFLVQDYFNLNLMAWLDASNSIELYERDVKTLTFNLLQSLAFVHQAGLMHRDVKPANILLDCNLRVKLCDFGFSRGVLDDSLDSSLGSSMSSSNSKQSNLPDSADFRSRNQKPLLTRRVCTRFYRPPEVILLERRYDQAVDLWSLGCVLGEMLKCSSPYKSESNANQRVLFQGDSCYPMSPQLGEDGRPMVCRQDQLRLMLRVLGQLSEGDKAFIQQNRPYLAKVESRSPPLDLQQEFNKSDQELVDILASLLQFNPNNRSSAADLLRNPCFNKMKRSHLPKAKPIKLLVDDLDLKILGAKEMKQLLRQEIEEVKNLI